MTEPKSEPVSVQQLKNQLRIEHSEEDELLKTYIVAAREYAESVTSNKVLKQQWQIAFDEFSDSMELPIRPLISVESVQYVDTDGATQTLDASIYSVDDFDFRAKINLAYGQDWPDTRAQSNAVLVNATFGNKQPPKRIQQAILLMASHWYENREDATEASLRIVPHGALRLLSVDNNRHF